MRNTKGDLCIAIFADQAGFKAEKPILEMKYKKNKMPKGEFRVIIQIKEGKYGLSVLDDENENGRMNYNILGIPQEGFGFSNYLHKGIKIPAFNDFSFIVEKNNIVEISVTMKYFNH
ncbi:MAG: DUF2141 domain-containing protein [Paludibacter sp.]|nr:DUF2141 domain-containing protein [Paludibacter sp.]